MSGETIKHLHQNSFPCGSAGKESACNEGDLDLIPGLGSSPGEGKGYPLLYSSLENSIDSIVYGIAKSQTRLSNFHFHTRTADVITRNYAIKLHHHFCFSVNISSVREMMVSYSLCMFILKLHTLATLIVRFTAGTSESDSLGSNPTSNSF